MRADPGGVPPVVVDLAGLNHFAGVVRSEADTTLRAGSGKARGGLGAGVCFGARSASGYVFAAKQRYAESLQCAGEQLAGFVQAAEILAAAAETVSANYRDTDALSAARSAEVEKALHEAVTAARRTQPDRTSGVRYE